MTTTNTNNTTDQKRRMAWWAEGVAEGKKWGRADLMADLAARKFGADAARELAGIVGPDLGMTPEVVDAIYASDSISDLLSRAEHLARERSSEESGSSSGVPLTASVGAASPQLDGPEPDEIKSAIDRLVCEEVEKALQVPGGGQTPRLHLGKTHPELKATKSELELRLTEIKMWWWAQGDGAGHNDVATEVAHRRFGSEASDRIGEIVDRNAKLAAPAIEALFASTTTSDFLARAANIA